MQLPQAMLENLRAGLGAAVLIAAVAPSSGCATTQADRSPTQAPFAGMGARANPTAPAPAIAPVASPFASPVTTPVVAPIAVEPVQPVAPPSERWECGPCGMG